MKNIVFTCILLSIFAYNLLSQKIEIVKENNLVYLIDKTVSKPQKVQYTSIYSCVFSKDFLIAENKKFFLVNLVSGKIIELAESVDDLKINGDSSYIENDKYLRFSEKGKIGLVKLPGNIIIAAKYSAIYPKDGSAGYFLLLNGKNWQFYYPKTNRYSMAFQVKNTGVLYLDNGLTYLPDNEAFPVIATDGIHLIKADGTDYLLDKSYKNNKELNFSGMTMILCLKDGKYGFVDEYGNIQVPFKYNWAEPMEGTAIVQENGKYGLIRENGSIAIPCIYDKIEHVEYENYRATKDGKSILINESGDPFDPFISKQVNNKQGFVGENGQILIPFSFDEVKSFKCGYASVKQDGKWGYILPTGNFIIKPQFEDVRDFTLAGMAPVKLNNKWGLIDFFGKYLIDPQYDSIQEADTYSFKLYNKLGAFEIGADRTIKTLYVNSEKGNFTDSRDGKTYKTIKVGNQIWMAQNLDFKTDESWYYENDDKKGIEYGRLYTWKAALNACPSDWHLPSDDEWKTLERSIGMPENEVDTVDYNRGVKESAKFKQDGSLGFDVKMGGFKHGYNNYFYKINDVSIIWTSTPNGDEYAYTRTFYANSDMISRDNNTYIKYGLPVRCIKNSSE
jgi:uncharacterized protein (TIGR02145 family)